VRALLETLKVPPIPARLLPPPWLRDLRLKGSSTPPKALMLAANARRLGRYDAVVTPERTTALLRKLGVKPSASWSTPSTAPATAGARSSRA
jgi:hypothetical protein